MTRLRWNEVERSLQPEAKVKKPLLSSAHENRSEIEKLAEEHRQFVSGLRKEARVDCTSLANRMLWLTLADSVLLIGLALTTRNIFGGSGLISLLLRLLYGLGAGSAALLLAASMGFAMVGATCTWEDQAGQPLPAEPMPRQALFKLVQAELRQLRQGLQRSSRLYYRARRFFIAALLPYLVAVGILILQIF